MARIKNKNPATKILIVDDHPAVREALAIRIAKFPDLRLCGEAADVGDALKVINKTKPDLAVIDVSLKTSDGLDLIKRIKAKNLKLRMLVWSMHSEDQYAERALHSGAHGYISKEKALGEIVQAIRTVASGKVYLSPKMSDKLLARFVGGGSGDLFRSPTDILSDRELEVLRLIGEGAKSKQIAAQRHLSVKTIETYRARIRKKLDLADSSELVRYASQWVLENK